MIERQRREIDREREACCRLLSGGPRSCRIKTHIAGSCLLESCAWTYHMRMQGGSVASAQWIRLGGVF